MKHVLFLGLLLSFIAQAYAEVLPPQWIEFAPPGMADAQLGPVRQPMSNGAIFSSVFIPGFTFVLLPIASSKKRHYEEDIQRNYWAQRRSQFDHELRLCEEEGIQKATCYMQVRQLQYEKTANYQAHLDQTALNKQVRALRVTKY